MISFFKRLFSRFKLRRRGVDVRELRKLVECTKFLENIQRYD